jgi:release factor glutamine methyltransferase
LPETGRLPAVAESTVLDAVRLAAGRLAEAGCETPRLDADVLLAWLLGVGRERLVIDGRSRLGADDAARYARLVARRAAREPVAYITGVKGFRRICVAVDPRVLIPRPETELLVEVGLSLGAGARVVDVGTGSGAVALALADERPDLVVTGVDVSGDAIEVARSNALRLGLDVSFVCGDLLEGVGGAVDAVLANLPYVAEGASLPPEVARYEPPGALFAGPDGLDQIRRLVAGVGGALLLAVEIGIDQAGPVASLVSGAGFGSVEVVADLAGHDRVVVGRR